MKPLDDGQMFDVDGADIQAWGQGYQDTAWLKIAYILFDRGCWSGWSWSESAFKKKPDPPVLK